MQFRKINNIRKTASKYLNELENIGILEIIQIKNSKFFINIELFAMLKKVRNFNIASHIC